MADSGSTHISANLPIVKTRKHVRCPIFGAPQELRSNMLPTYSDVITYYLWVRHSNKGKKELRVSEICEVVASKVEELWRKASIPTVINKRVLQMVQSYHTKYMNIIKPYKGRKDNKKFKVKIKRFADEAKTKLFDIAACKCVVTCTCDKSRRVPGREKPFLHDQRTERKMLIGSIDVIVTQQLRKKKNRKAKEKDTACACDYKKNSMTVVNVKESKTEHISDPESDQPKLDELEQQDTEDSPNPLPLTSICLTLQTQMRISLPSLARTCDRFGVSNRSAAAIASATLQDIGLISKEDASKVIDKNKIWRERLKSRMEHQFMGELANIELHGLYFDGRRDKTMVQEKLGNKYYRREIMEEHVVLLQEPNSKYIGHVSPESGSAISIKRSIVAYLQGNNITTDKLVAVGCDGTIVNTGHKGGVIRLLEVELKRPLQWLICLLHANELPLRHLVEYLDGQTTGPNSFSGIIGKGLDTCEKLPVVPFEKVKSKWLDVNVNDLSTDQKYLLDMFKAVQSGQCSIDLARRHPGRLSHARWLTAANRILRLYVGTENPTSNLKALVEFIMNVYTPLWFAIKVNPSCKDGAKHLWRLVNLSRYLPNDLKVVIDPVIQRNAYFAHPENLLLAMITDERKHIRQLGIRRILKARKLKVPGTHVRCFEVPQINFEAAEYTEIINWQSCHVTEPPLTVDISDKDLKLFLTSETVPAVRFHKLPCHTQAVERCIKLVTDAASKVCGAKARDGFVKMGIKSREIMPNFETKSEYRLK